MLSIALCSSTVNAQTVTNDQNTVKTCVKADGKKCDKVDGKKGDKKKGDKKDRKGRRDGNLRANGAKQRPDMFAGLTLTDAQKSQLQALQDKRRDQVKERLANRPAKDSTLTAEQRKEMRAQKERSRRDSQLEYLREVKEIIGPDQYVIFLENMVVNRPARMDQGFVKNMKHGKTGKEQRKDRMARHDKKQSRQGRAGDAQTAN